MRTLIAALAVALAAMTIAVPAHAKPTLEDVPACVGYSWCYETTGNGFALFCVQYKSNWMCGECEACGNDPIGRLPVLP